VNKNLFASLMLLILWTPGAIAEPLTRTIRIKDHLFHPARLEVPAGVKVKLIIINEDDTAEEFESYPLNREKIIRGGRRGIIYIGPLEPGSYPFFGEFNQDTAQGVIIAVKGK